MLANPEVSVALGSLDKKPTGFPLDFGLLQKNPQLLKNGK
jgi:hypothetical protein